MAAVNDKNASFPIENVNETMWLIMEKGGVVFLPAAGYRTRSATVENPGSEGYYWTNSLHGVSDVPDNATAVYMYFTGSNLNHDENGYRKTGYSVRLVKDVVFY